MNVLSIRNKGSKRSQNPNEKKNNSVNNVGSTIKWRDIQMKARKSEVERWLVKSLNKQTDKGLIDTTNDKHDIQRDRSHPNS